MMVAAHPTAPHNIDRTSPLRGRGFEPAPIARMAALSTSIRPADRALSSAGLPLPSLRIVLSLMAVESERFARSESLVVRIAD